MVPEISTIAHVNNVDAAQPPTGSLGRLLGLSKNNRLERLKDKLFFCEKRMLTGEERARSQARDIDGLTMRSSHMPSIFCKERLP